MRRQIRQAPHDRFPPARFCAAAGPARPAELAGPVVAFAAGAATPTPHRFSADTPSVRNCAEGGNAGAYTVVAHSAAAGIGGTRHRGCGRTALESSSRDRE